MRTRSIRKALLPAFAVLLVLASLLPASTAAEPDSEIIERIPANRGRRGGMLDGTFGTAGLMTESWPYPEGRRSYAVLGQPDGRILFAGGHTNGATIMRRNPDGSPDGTFGIGGRVTFGPEGFGVPGSVLAMALRPDGKVVVLGERTGPVSWDTSDWYRYVARLHPDGSLDTGFGAAGFAVVGDTYWNERLNALALQADGKIVVGGHRWQFYLARLNEDGSPDTGFGVGGELTTSFPVSGGSAISTVLIQPDGRIVAVGSAGDVGIARYEPDGTLDATFASGGLLVSNMVMGPSWGGLQPDGSIVVGGFWRDILHYPEMAVTRYLADGSLDTAFGDAGRTRIDFGYDQDTVEDGLIQEDGKIVLVGTVSEGSLEQSVGLTRLNPDGGLDTRFGLRGKFSIKGLRSPHAAAVALQPGGGIIAAGWSFEQSDTDNFVMWFLARFVP